MLRSSFALRIGLGIGVFLGAVALLGAQEPVQTTLDNRPKDALGMPPRVAPTDYQAQGKVGNVTIAADFVRHSVPTAAGTLSTEDYVVVEVALYGPPDSRLAISWDNFSLRINASKKPPLHTAPFGLALSSMKDPEWSPPDPPKKSKTSLGGGGEGGNDPPPVVHIPIEVQRSMAQRVQRASLSQGDRPLPQAGILFFPYRGRADKIDSVELIYAGPAGKITIDLQP